MTAPSLLKIALAQLNPIVGDLRGNAKRAAEAHARAKAAGADVIVFSELFLNGYPPEDLVLKPAFQEATRAELERLASLCADGPALLMGTIWREAGKLYNAVALLDGGRIEAVSLKSDLPNYGVFDEKRVFASGPMPGPLNVRGVRLGVPICEDIWGPEVVETLAETGAEILISPNGSPFDWPKPDSRMNVTVARVTESGLPLVYLNQVGGQDELVFDGASFVLNKRSKPCGAAPGVARGRRRDGVGANTVGLAVQSRRCCKARRGSGCRLSRLRPGSQRLRREERLSGCRARAVGRHRFRARRRDRGRCAGARACPRPHAAVEIHLRRQP